jgi:hypothetical protein
MLKAVLSITTDQIRWRRMGIFLQQPLETRRLLLVLATLISLFNIPLMIGNQVGAKSAEYKAQKNNAIRGFSHGQLVQKGDIISSHVESFNHTLKRYLENDSNESIDFDAWIGNLILDIHVKLTIGHEFHAIDKGPSSHTLVRTMHKTAKVLQYLTQLLYLPLSLSSLSNLQIFRRDIFTIFSSISPLGTAITERLERMDAAENCVDLGKEALPVLISDALLTVSKYTICRMIRRTARLIPTR